MRSPDELVEVPWTEFADGESVPLLIEILYGDSTDFDECEASELCDAIFNVGTVYPVTIQAIPFLAHAALYATQRVWALGLLAALTDRTDARGLEAEACGAVAAEAANLLPCLLDPDPEVRRLPLRIFGGCATLVGPDRAGIEAAVVEVFDHDPDVQARADALTVLELLEDDGSFAGRIEQAVTSTDLVLRLAGMLCALEVGYMADSARWAALAGEAGALSDELDDREWLPIIGTRGDRLARVLEMHP